MLNSTLVVETSLSAATKFCDTVDDVRLYRLNVLKGAGASAVKKGQNY